MLPGVHEALVREAMQRLACGHSFTKVGCLDCDRDFLWVVVVGSLQPFLPQVCQISLSGPQLLPRDLV